MMLQFGFFFGGGDGDDDGAPAVIVILLVSLVVYVVSFFLMLALSRYREFSADRGAALVTGRPSALSSALMKISGTMERVPQQDLRQAEDMNAFFIVPAGVKSASRRSSPRTRRWRSASSASSSSRRSPAGRPPPRRWVSSTRSSGARRSSRAWRPTACSR